MRGRAENWVTMVEIKHASIMKNRADGKVFEFLTPTEDVFSYGKSQSDNESGKTYKQEYFMPSTFTHLSFSLPAHLNYEVDVSALTSVQIIFKGNGIIRTETLSNLQSPSSAGWY